MPTVKKVCIATFSTIGGVAVTGGLLTGCIYAAERANRGANGGSTTYRQKSGVASCDSSNKTKESVCKQQLQSAEEKDEQLRNVAKSAPFTVENLKAAINSYNDIIETLDEQRSEIVINRIEGGLLQATKDKVARLKNRITTLEEAKDIAKNIEEQRDEMQKAIKKVKAMLASYTSSSIKECDLLAYAFKLAKIPQKMKEHMRFFVRYEVDTNPVKACIREQQAALQTIYDLLDNWEGGHSQTRKHTVKFRCLMQMVKAYIEFNDEVIAHFYEGKPPPSLSNLRKIQYAADTAVRAAYDKDDLIGLRVWYDVHIESYYEDICEQ